MHWIREEGLESAALQVGFVLQAVEEGPEVRILLALCQNLQAVVVIPHVLLVDTQHWQQHVEQVPCSVAQQMKG